MNSIRRNKMFTKSWKNSLVIANGFHLFPGGKRSQRTTAFNNGEKFLVFSFLLLFWIWNIDYLRWNINNCCSTTQSASAFLHYCFFPIRFSSVGEFLEVVYCMPHASTHFLLMQRDCVELCIWIRNTHKLHFIKESVFW